MKIKYEKDNDCVSCPQGCVHCGRGDYSVPVAIECELCLEDCDEIFQTPDGDFCRDCLTVAFNRVTVDDIANNMGAYEDELWEKV